MPQFYLRYFATPETRDSDRPQIWAFPRYAGDEFRTRVRNVAAQRDLYSFCAPQVDDRLSDLESFLGRFWPTLTQDRYPLDLAFKRGISLFIATLFLRHPSQLERHRRFTSSVAKSLEAGPKDQNGKTQVNVVEIAGKEHPINPGELDRFRTMSDEEIQAAWGRTILTDSGYLAQQLIDRPWTVLVTAEPAFITTDHPVALHNESRSDAPIVHSETRVYFALSPTKLVLINGNKSDDGKLVQIRDGAEAVFNYCIYRSAYKHVFSSWDSMEMLNQIAHFGEWARAESKRRVDDMLQRAKWRIGRNDPCYCGSGMKFKRCCGR